MRKFRNTMIALLIGCFAPVMIWVGAGVAIYQGQKRAKVMKAALQDFTCSIDADCPPGYVCVGGRCIPDNAA